MRSLYLCLLFGLLQTCWGRSVEHLPNLGNSQVIRAFPESRADLLVLKKLKTDPEYDFWLRLNDLGLPVDIMAKGEKLECLKTYLSENGIQFEIFIPDVELSVKVNLLENLLAQKNYTASGKVDFFAAYQSYDEIIDWLFTLKNQYPTKVALINLGRSYQYREMYVVKLSKKLDPQIFKPAVWVDGGMHGREWISPAVVLYMLKELLFNKDYEPLLDKLDFYFIPVMNPDGYSYSFSEKGRLWRKTRSKTDSIINCIGVDPNRNWDFHWNVLQNYPTGSNDGGPCSDTYPGESPFSEKEVEYIRKEILSKSMNIKAYISYHSYGQLWLFPWGYTSEKIHDFNEIETVSNQAVEEIYLYRSTRYKQQAMCLDEELCIFGDSLDWVRGVTHIKYSFFVNLPDLGNYGYLLPPSEIVPTGEESIRGLLSIASKVAKGNG